MVLRIRLTNPIMHCGSRGQTVKLSFNSEHHQELEEAAARVFDVPVSSTHLSLSTVTDVADVVAPHFLLLVLLI